VLKAYFDSSGNKEDQYMSLAGIVSSEANWPEFEKRWMAVLKSYSLREFHMSAAMAKRGQFAEWTDEAVKKITNDLVNVLGRFPGPEFILKSCTVKMEDYRRAKAENIHLRRPEAMCVNFCCGTGLPPDKSDPDSLYHKVGFYFDRNEPYLRTICSNWQKRRRHSGWPRQIHSIQSVTAGNYPALQAADVVAWIANGFHKGDTRAKPLFIIIPLSGGMHEFYDYERIKSDYGNDRTGVDPYAYKGT
jgi:Protein of unknown function (DUF3800)